MLYAQLLVIEIALPQSTSLASVHNFQMAPKLCFNFSCHLLSSISSFSYWIAQCFFFCTYRSAQYLQYSTWPGRCKEIYSRGCPIAPPPPSHTAISPSTSMTGIRCTSSRALDLCLPRAYCRNSKRKKNYCEQIMQYKIITASVHHVHRTAVSVSPWR